MAKALVLTTGTYLKGRIIIGDVSYPGGPNGQFPSIKLADSLRELGFEMGRFKTGTPARINRKSVDFKKMIIQPGDEELQNFSFISPVREREQLPCWLTYTNEETHKIIMENINRSPLFSGEIKGTGPRYCPSIEDKVVKFADKPAHQVFIEPEGRYTNEMYVQGMSTSLPEDVQIKVLRSIKGLERVEVMRPGYAIEYDYLIPVQLKHSLETKEIEGLFTAGQINGTSGYEEAAAQGIVAGINAALYVKEKEPLVIQRSEGYIGVLIDDLVIKGTNEPYRMMTSRAEYRLMLRQDNADLRLTEKGFSVGLVTKERYENYLRKKELIEKEKARLERTSVPVKEEVLEILKSVGSSEIQQNVSASTLLRRPEIEYQHIEEMLGEDQGLPQEVKREVETEIKYEGYLKKQRMQVEKFKKLESRLIPKDIDYRKVKGLSTESIQKLEKIKPVSIGQAARISGVNPADITVLMIYLEKKKLKS